MLLTQPVEFYLLLLPLFFSSYFMRYICIGMKKKRKKNWKSPKIKRFAAGKLIVAYCQLTIRLKCSAMNYAGSFLCRAHLLLCVSVFFFSFCWVQSHRCELLQWTRCMWKSCRFLLTWPLSRSTMNYTDTAHYWQIIKLSAWFRWAV